MDPTKLQLFRQAAIQQGYKPADVDKFLKAKQEEMAISKLAEAGYTDVESIAATNPILAQKIAESTGVGPKISEDERKQQLKLKDISTNLDALERNLEEVEVRGRGPADIGLLQAGLTGGKINPQLAQYESFRKGLIGPVARAISGEVGVLTDKDIARAEGLLPKATDSKELAKAKIDELRKLISAKQPGAKTQVTTTTEAAKPMMTPMPQQQAQPDVISQLLGQVLQRGKVPTSGTNLQMGQWGKMLFPRAAAIKEAETAGQDVTGDMRLGAAGEGIASALPLLAGPLGGVGAVGALGASGAISGATEPGADIGDRLKGAVVGGASGAALGKALQLAPKVLRPFKSAGEYRAAKIAEAKGKTISGDKIVQALEKAKVSPADKASYDRYITAAKDMFTGKTMGIDDAIQLNQEANKAFTAAGKVGKSAKAAFNKAMGDSIKSQLKVTAPDVAKANKIFSTLYGAKDTARKLIVPGAVGYYLMRKLGL